MLKLFNIGNNRMAVQAIEPAGKGIQKAALKMATPEGLEPPTYWFEANRSIHLSYGVEFSGRLGLLELDDLVRSRVFCLYNHFAKHYATSTREEDKRTIQGMVDQAGARINKGDVGVFDDFWDENADYVWS